MATSQHRCVFVGNIPYDATEEQLIEICQEIGPVVSFRLVIDRETGKPKGYGFCEYKDEETALSARRNLQGYEINGRQLRVDFAENDKGSDRNREQGRGGHGLSASVDPHKQIAGSVIHGEAAHHQPIGLHIALTAATAMEAALGGSQPGIQSNQNSLRVQSGMAHDPLTLHLAKLSRNQLTELISELKAMATHNKESAHQLLLSRPQLSKALFQAQIMLGLVTPQTLQMPNLRQTSQPPVGENQLGQSTVLQSVSGLPSHAQIKLQSGLIPNIQETQASALHHNSLVPNQLVSHPRPPLQPRMQHLQHPSNPMVQLGTLPGHSSSALPAVRPQPSFNLPVRPTNQPGLSVGPPIQLTTSTPLTQQTHMLQHSGFGNPSVGQNIRIRPDAGFQPGPSMSAGIPLSFGREADRSAKVIEDSNLGNKRTAYSNNALGSREKINDPSEPFSRPSKQIKLDDGRSSSFSAGATNLPVPRGSSHVLGSVSLPVNATSKLEAGYPEQQPSQAQVQPDMESVLLQQVLSLTPEQLSSLPLEQQQQVLQLQQSLRRDQTQPS